MLSVVRHCIVQHLVGHGFLEGLGYYQIQRVSNWTEQAV